MNDMIAPFYFKTTIFSTATEGMYVPDKNICCKHQFYIKKSSKAWNCSDMFLGFEVFSTNWKWNDLSPIFSYSHFLILKIKSQKISDGKLFFPPS